MRAASSIVLAAIVAFASIGTHHHARRARPHAVVSSQSLAHHHHARAHRTPAALAARALLPQRRELTIVPSTIQPSFALDREPPALVARGPPA
jgi:hypothetical protein